MESEVPELLERISARLTRLRELRDEAVGLRAELADVDRGLAAMDERLRTVRGELSRDLEPERRAALLGEAHELTEALERLVVTIEERDYQARIEIHEIEMGIATSDAIRLRARADELLRDNDERDPT
jgi:hypothetical protein